MNTSNPVVQQAAGVTAVIVVIKTTITYIRVMGWLDLTPEQEAATFSFIETVLPIVAVWILALWAMRRVTPLSEPRDVDGTPLSRPGDVPAIPQMAKMQQEATKINDKIDERRIERGTD